MILRIRYKQCIHGFILLKPIKKHYIPWHELACFPRRIKFYIISLRSVTFFVRYFLFVISYSCQPSFPWICPGNSLNPSNLDFIHTVGKVKSRHNKLGHLTMTVSNESLEQVFNRITKEIRKLTFRVLALRRSESIRSDEGLTLETSASESLYGGQFTLSTQLIKPNYLVMLPPTQHNSFFRNSTRQLSNLFTVANSHYQPSSDKTK